MKEIRRNRFTLSRQDDASYDEPDTALPRRRSRGKVSSRQVQAAVAGILVLAALGGTLLLIKKYRKPESVLSKLEKTLDGESGVYTRGDRVETPISDSTNIHLRRGIDSYARGYFNDAANEFNEVLNTPSTDQEKAQALTYLGIIEDERGNFTKAVEFYRRALKYDASSAITFRNIAITYRRMKQLPEALEAAAKAAELQKSAANLILKGNIYYEMRKYGEALDAYKAALSLEPDNASALYNTGQVYLKRGDEPLAIEYFRKATESDRSGKIAYLAQSRLGIIFLDRGDYPLAEQYLRNAVNMNRNEALDHYNLGIVLLRQGKNDEALAEFLRAQELGSQDSALLENLGSVYTTLRQFDRGIETYQKILAQNARNTKILARMGELYYNKGDFDSALDAFRKVTDLEPVSENARIAFLNIGNILDEAQRFDEAIAAYEKALAINPKDDMALYNLGIAWKHKGRNEKAIESWQAAKRLNPDNPKPHMAMADLFYDSGYLDDALSEYLKITEKWPTLADAQFSVATIYNRKGVLDFAEKRYLKVAELNTSKELTTKAYVNLGIIASNSKTDDPDAGIVKGLDYVQKALLTTPGDKDALTALGIMYYKRGSYDQAIETFYQVLKSTQDAAASAEAYNNIGKAHYKKGEYREALRAFNLGLESDPTSEELRMNRKAASQAYENKLSSY